MKINNRFLSTFLALVMVVSLTFGITITTFAEEDQAKSNVSTETVTLTTDAILAVDEIVGTSASSLDSLFSENQRVSREGSPLLSSVTLAYEDSKLVLRGILTYDNKVVNLVSSGDLYKNEKTDNAETYGNLILGDMNDFDNIHFVQFRIDKDKSYIIIILQTNDTEQLMQFKMPIDNSKFDTIYYLQENQLSGTDLEKKIVELYSVTGNLIDKDSSTGEGESISPVVSTNSNQSMAT